jgi:hypothetical protein
VFYAFGRALGPRHLAVWFWRDNVADHTSKNLDTDRSAAYCQNYRLLPSDGPYISVTRENPEFYTDYSIPPNEKIADRYVVSLNGLDADAITKVVTTLTDQILVTGLDQSELDTTIWWQRLWIATSKATHAAGCYFNKVSFSLKTSVINAEIAHSTDAGC